MAKKLSLFGLFFSLFLLAGCDFYTRNTTVAPTTQTTEAQSEFEIWRDSDDARDLNGDRKINEADFEIYQIKNNYDVWKNSVEALDQNGDSKIDESDFDFYRIHNFFDVWKTSDEAEDLNGDTIIDTKDFEIYGNYDLWKSSTEAMDLNGDSSINVFDFEIYNEFIEFVGDYHIANYSFVSSETYVINSTDIKVSDFGLYLSQMSLSVNNNGEVTATIPESIRTTLGDFYAVLLEGANNMTITRISPYIVGIDTTVTIDTVLVNFTLYLNETEGGYSTTYILGDLDGKPVISFSIIKDE
jgi:hypothetical protein